MRSQIRTFAVIALLLRSAAPVAATADDQSTFGSAAEFLAESSDAAIARLQLEPLDESHPVDALLLELMEELDLGQISDLLLRYRAIETKLSWSEGHGSFARAGVGVALDRGLQRRLEAKGELDREVVSFLLAHLQAHMMQMRVYSLESLGDPANAEALEAQADILAGMTLAQTRRFRHVHLRGLMSKIEKGVRLAQLFGHPSWYPRASFSVQNRTRLAAVGVDAGNYYVEVWTCVTNLGKPETLRALKTATRRVNNMRRKNPSLPLFNPKVCVAGEPFYWSERRARREVSR